MMRTTWSMLRRRGAVSTSTPGGAGGTSGPEESEWGEELKGSSDAPAWVGRCTWRRCASAATTSHVRRDPGGDSPCSLEEGQSVCEGRVPRGCGHSTQNAPVLQGLRVVHAVCVQRRRSPGERVTSCGAEEGKGGGESASG